MSSPNTPCLLCGGLLGGHRQSCTLNALMPRAYEFEPGMQTVKMLASPPKIAPMLVQRLWLDGLSLHKIALATGITPRECEDIMRKRCARLVRERAR